MSPQSNAENEDAAASATTTLAAASDAMKPSNAPRQQHSQQQQQQQQQQLQQPSTNYQRRESIDSFLANLTAWDLLYIRGQFRDGKVSIDGFAGLSELPPEVFSYIVPHLRLEDVLNCYLVCRSWRETWTQGAVATALCRRFFPGLLELYGGDVPDRHDLFLAATKRYLRRHLMRCSTRAFISWDVGWSSDYFRNRQRPTVELLEDLRQIDFGYSPLTVCYENGKVAWQPGNCYVIVDDLRTRQRQRFSFGIDYISGRPLQLQSITESLVVLASSMPPFSSPHMMDNGQAIQVFHLDLLESKRISLPGKFARCYAQGDTAAFVTKQGHVIAWSWGDKAIELKIDDDELHHRPMGWEKDLGGVPGVLFHPTETDVMYVVWLNWVAPPDPRINTVVVVKYEDGQPIKRFETSLSHPRYQRDPHSRHSCPAMRFTLSCQKMNAYGLYSVGIAQYVLYEEGSMQTESEQKEVEWISIGFNVLTESFVKYEYQSQRRPYPPQVKNFDIRAWDDQLIITWFDEYLIGRQYPYSMQWLDASHIEGEDTGQRSNGIDNLARWQRVDICKYMLEIGFGRRVFADEDFLIITTGQGYLVCSWNQEVDLPGQVASDSSRNPPWPVAGERLEPPRLPSLWDCRTVTSLRAV
ncbi:hypothetical protein PT974_05373 [Cladobotryum mycophilum]|uniref:F-box domain-containing protein n=1 Tax=Cladobotryum mycophilum TaxID=491253 RepID=A0ABR0SIH6_9HYPO